MQNPIIALLGAVAVIALSAHSVAAGHGYALTGTTGAAASGPDHVKISHTGDGVMVTDYRESIAPVAGSGRIHVAELTWQPGAGPASVATSAGLICEMTAGELDLLASDTVRKVEAGDVWVCSQDQVQAAKNHGTEPAVLRILGTAD